MYVPASSRGLNHGATRALLVYRRCMASLSSASSSAPLSKYEPNRRIDYSELISRIENARKVLNRPLTYAEKILYANTDNLGEVERGTTQIQLRPQRVACQDATAQMAMIQFMSTGLETTVVPTTVHCDHLIVGTSAGQDTDLPAALDAHKEVYDFLSSACQRYGMGFWRAGAGIIHQTVLENYAFPGGIMVGTDSHTPNAGGLGMIAIGVGGADAVEVMAGLPFELKAPRIVGVHLTGKLGGWATPKDVINKLASILTVKGGTGNIIEFFGPGAATLSATGMCTITNMGAETGATTSIFPYSPAMSDYLKSTGRHEMASALRFASNQLVADPSAEYDRVINIDLSSLEPRINGPYTPDLSIPLSEFRTAAEENKWPANLTAGLIGSCTNSSFEDMTRAASLARQAIDAGLTPKMPLLISPGSEKTRATLRAAGVLDTFEELEGSTMLTNACGPCSGSWKRTDVEKGTKNSILTTYNRNFTGRVDGNPATNVFITSPEVVMAKIFSDDLGFDPSRDALTTPDGREFRFSPPPSSDKVSLLPTNGYADADYVYLPPPAFTDNSNRPEVQISPDSSRLQRLAPFEPWHGRDFEDCTVLIKTAGKCTTDHITPAGPWFRYRGHLDNISNNTLIGAVNADTGEVGRVRNWMVVSPDADEINDRNGGTGSDEEKTPAATTLYDTPAAVARNYKAAGHDWVIIADHNYGEGSSREHAALQPRFLGCRAVVARSFARIHEANLKKQGVLALTMEDEGDYDRIGGGDRVSVTGLKELGAGAGKPPVVLVEVRPRDRSASGGGGGEKWIMRTRHSMTGEEIEYFKEGSALNLMAKRAAIAGRKE